MLVLSRKPDTSFTIHTSDGLIRVKFLEFFKGGIRLGVEAPRQCKILRDELKDNHIGRRDV